MKLSLLALALLTPLAASQSTFVNFESPHVHPLELTPDNQRLLAVNTPDNRLEVFDVTAALPQLVLEIPVGLDPVSVRTRSSSEAWVVNVISDSISIIDLATGHVKATLKTLDEPADVIFAGTPERAYVSCAGAGKLQVFDPANLAAAPAEIAIAGEQPRALARSADGSRVYVAIFESGNGTTVLGGGSTTNNATPPNVVSNPAGPYGGQNPPPNSGNSFNPPIAAGLPTPPRVSLIVRRNSANQWKDDNNRDWTSFVSGANASASGRPAGWTMTDNDIGVIQTATNAVSYSRRLMNICMGLAVNPANGQVTLVGTEATNEIRFEPNLKGKFVRVHLARVDATGATTQGISDLNPHLTYAAATVPQADRNKSIGDPRGIVWNSSGTRAYVSGMGSNNVIVIDALGARAGLAQTIEVGEGPTGVALHESASRLYALNKFEGSISVISTGTELEIARVPFFDPSPAAIKLGRRHLYGTHETSGLGQASCAACHIDSRMDRLAWDLGDPQGAMKATTGQNVQGGAGQPWHPMKGPMTTQTLQDIVGKEPLHWRGDRAGLEEFNPAFVALNGDDVQLTAAQMQEFENFLATIHYPPNPFRNLDNTLPTNLALPGHFTTGRFGPAGQPLPNGNAVAGLNAYRTAGLDGGINCVTCHTLPTGVGTDYRLVGAQLQPFPIGPNGENHTALVTVDGFTNVTMKISQLRNMHKKGGFNFTQTSNTQGFGFAHDGSVDSLERFVNEPVFNLTGDQMTADMVAFMKAFSGSELPVGSPTNITEPPGPPSKDSHAAVGAQITINAPAPTPALLTTMLSLASANKVGLVAKSRQGGIARGYTFIGGNNFQSDRVSQVLSASALQALATVGSEITYTIVPKGSETRIGIDRDLDGCFDRDELDLLSNPSDPASNSCGMLIAYCFGDGSTAAACPCANNGSAGRGCANSQPGSTGAQLTSSGAPTPNDTLVLQSAGMLPTATAVFLQGNSNVSAGVVFGDGVRCVGGSLKRLAVKSSVGGAAIYPDAALSELSIRNRSAALGDPIPAGGVRYYQTYYRDPSATFCANPPGSTYNITNGLIVQW